jgi:hypothetical protein
MLYQETHPRSPIPRQIQPEIKALHHGRLHTRFKDVVEDMGSEFLEVKAQSIVVFDEERNAHMSCLHESNEIETDMFGLPEDKEYIEETDTGDEPLRRQDSQPTQLGKRFSSHMPEAADEEAENSHSRRLRREDQTAHRSAGNA